MRHGVFLAPFGPFADPGRVARLAARAEETGWDGFFVWDHVFYVDVQELADPWVTLAAVAGATERMTLGPMITPVPRRRMPKLARETVTLDRLAAGRLVLGVGLGSDRSGEFDRPGEEPDPRLRALLLDEGLEELTGLWRERAIPIWVGSKGLAGPPLRRAARWDGWFPVNVESPDEFAEGVARIRRLREDAGLGDRPFEYAIELSRGDDPAPLARAGATWLLTDFGSHPDPAEVTDVVEAGPPPA